MNKHRFEVSRNHVCQFSHHVFYSTYTYLQFNFQMGPKKGGKGGGTEKGGKGGKSGADKSDGGKKEKGNSAGNSVNVRHILCEKQSKCLEALEKIKGGAKFNEVRTTVFSTSTAHNCLIN